MSKRNVIILVFSLLFIIGAGSAYYIYTILYGQTYKLKETVYLYIDESKNFDGLCDQLSGIVPKKDLKHFRLLADYLEYPDNMKTGKYAVINGMSQMQLINTLRRGQQTSVRLTFNNIRLKKDLAERLAEQLMVNEQSILSRLNDSVYCDSLGFSTETINVMFIPNTYEVYWNISADGLFQRMKREYDNFWTEKRRNKAKEIGLTPVEVSILASIVEEETAARDEYPIVAGLYLNRLNRNIPLQADPTVKFAVGDFSLQRILYVHLEVDSPYNTYKHTGLPPGPLRTPSIRSIDAVLNHTVHKYLYMCAKEDFSGRHNFAITLAEHNRNAERYRAELNRRQIR
ncbi:endolytic transglycosylase MltG [Massilibacteroides sp.]|uniref:endolytic transglycosylase MltG n=1 Tax=Massilibacteroides sp. TaxID=2034766 RepID=UPI00260B80B8|nr:endolytic transglycosylase MltG [Massilibacteroides sp.]MDD4515114.1 endolytic transglycosylase MltG [Massilibacteroides sp.]